jgi:glycosyl transferase family 25
MNSSYPKQDQASSQAGKALLAACGDMYVINLPERQDRRDEFAAQLARIGLSFDHPNVHLSEAVRPQEAGQFPSIGARGCFLSHLNVLRAALERGDDHILLCEDDLNFSRDLPRRATLLAAELGRQWDMFYGFTGADSVGPAIDSEGKLIALVPEQTFQCSHIIAFSRRAIQALVPYLEAMLSRPAGDPAGGPMHVDGAYHWFRKDHPEFRVLAARPDIGYQRSSMTNIAPITLKDRLFGLRHLVALLRKLRNRTR